MRKRALLGLVVLLVAMSWVPLAYCYTYYANGYAYTIEQLTLSQKDAPWTFKATTDDPTVTKVVFTCYDPNGQLFGVQTISGSSTFINTFIPNQFGWWELQIDFQNNAGASRFYNDHQENIKEQGYIPYPQVPEIPLLGTVGAAVAMLLGFVYYVKRKNGSTSLKHVPHL